MQIGMSITQLQVLARALETSGYLRVPVTGQDDNGTVHFKLGGENFMVDVHGNVSRPQPVEPDSRSAYRIVLDNAVEQAKAQGIFQEGDDNLLALETNRMTNMTGGRHSDNARTVTRGYLRNPEGFRTDFITSRENGR